LRYGEARGSPTVTGDGGASSTKVDAGDRVGRWYRWSARGGAPRQRGPSGDVGGVEERPVEAGTREALGAGEELGVGYFGFTATDGSRVTPSLRRVLSSRGRRLEVF
jgi:hypothetical protein